MAKLACCSKRSTALKKANYTKAKKAADAASKGPHPPPKKAAAKKATAKKAKPCRACSK